MGEGSSLQFVMQAIRDEERAAIVAFLRTKPTWACNRGLINAIERGDHLNEGESSIHRHDQSGSRRRGGVGWTGIQE